MFQVANVIVVRDGVVADNLGLVADDSGIVVDGLYTGKELGPLLEKLFYAECRKLDPTLPEECLNEVPDEDLPENYPSFDDGYWHPENNLNVSVCMTHSNLSGVVHWSM